MNVRATNLSNGTDKVACFMNSIKIEDNQVVIYNSEDPEIKSAAPLPVYDVSKPVATTGEVYVDNYIDSDKRGSDCTAELQNLIDSTADNVGTGITFIFGAGVYKMKDIILPAKTKIKGAGMGITILQRNQNASIMSTATDSVRGAYGFISVPGDAYGCEITDLSIYGGTQYAAAGDVPPNMLYNDSSSMNGISVEDNTVKSVTSTNAAADTWDVLTSNNKLQSGGNRNLKFLEIRNVSIFGMYGAGIYIGKYNNHVTVDNVIIACCRRDGITSNGDLNNFSNLNIFGNGEHGIYDLGGGNKYVNVESQYNGRYAHTTAAGICLSGSRAMFNNIHCKENYCSGLIMNGTFNTVSNFISDANGGKSSAENGTAVSNPVDVSHIVISGSYQKLDGIIMNSKGSSSTKIARNTIVTSSDISKSVINLTIGTNSSTNDGSINGITLKKFTVNKIISDDNLINYIDTYVAPVTPPADDSEETP